MDAFVDSVVWHCQAFLMTARGDVWRIWFKNTEPLMERLIGNESEYGEPLSELRERRSASTMLTQHWPKCKALVTNNPNDCDCPHGARR